MVLTTASLYFGLLAFGCLAPLPLVKLKEIGVGFYRFFGYACVGLAVLGLVFFFWAGKDVFGPLYFFSSIGFLIFTLVFTLALRARSGWLIWGTFGVAVLSGFFSVVLPWQKFLLPTDLEPLSGMAEKMGWGPSWVLMGHALSSALLMGFATLAMMLGHWYLVTPKLSITPLKRFAGGYILLCVWKAFELAVSYWVFVGPSWEMPRTQMGYLLAHREVIFVLFRVTWGVLAPLGFSYWIWQTVKMKSTQSATGILYAAMVCTLIGEGIGLFLTLRTGVPF